MQKPFDLMSLGSIPARAFFVPEVSTRGLFLSIVACIPI
jgi:hypothetical protein